MRTLPSTRMSELLQGCGVCGTLNGWRSRLAEIWLCNKK
jgi:hypothetical protein